MDSTLSHELSFLARHRLALILDQESPLAMDWRGLADKMEFTYSMVTMLRGKQSPTMALLEEWERFHGKHATLDNLIELTKSLGNQPALETLQSAKVEAQKKKRVSPFDPLPNTPTQTETLGDNLSPVQVNYQNNSAAVSKDLSSNKGVKQIEKDIERLTFDNQKQLLNLDKSATSHDDPYSRQRALSVKDKQLLSGVSFDVFLSFADEDTEFATEIHLRLSHRAGISVYVPSEAMMPGKSFVSEVADQIKQGCKKTLIILSPDYLKSPWCHYEACLAVHRNPDPRRHTLIPIMYSKCEVPAFISHLFYLDYPRYKDDVNKCEEYFWKRLYKSVKIPEH